MIAKFICLILAKFLSPISSFIIVVLIARIHGDGFLGKYHTVLVWFVLFQHVSICGICEFISREIGARKKEAGKYVSHGILIAFFFGIPGIILLVCGSVFCNYPESVRQSMIIVCFALPFTSIVLICQAAFTALQKIKYVAAGCFVESALLLIGGVIAIITAKTIVALIMVIVIIRVTSSFLNLYLLKRCIQTIPPVVDREFIKSILQPILVFGLTGIAFQIFMRIDIIFLSLFKEMANVGIFSSASKLWEVSLMIPLAFYFLNLPVLADAYRNDSGKINSETRSYIQFYLYFVFIVFGIGFFFAEAIIDIIYGKNFIEAAAILRLLMCAFLIHCSEIIFEMSIQAAGYQMIALKIALGRAAVNIGLNLIFIPLWGASGAALATVISIMCSFWLFHYHAKEKLKDFSFNTILIKPTLVCITFMTVLAPFTGKVNLVLTVIVFLGVFMVSNVIIHNAVFVIKKRFYTWL